MTKLTFACSLLALCGAAQADVYNDSTGDMFGTAPSNLDISSVNVTNDAQYLYISVTTVGFESWTKYMLFLNTGNGPSTGSNAWNRPVDLNGQQIDHFVGSWVDQGSDNSQLVTYMGVGGWDWGNFVLFSNSVNPNTVTWAISLQTLGLEAGDSLLFDVATSGGGDGDAGIDHLSRSDMATGWWTDTSVAGAFRKYELIPAPGALALLGMTTLFGRGRRSR